MNSTVTDKCGLSKALALQYWCEAIGSMPQAWTSYKMCLNLEPGPLQVLLGSPEGHLGGMDYHGGPETANVLPFPKATHRLPPELDW